MKPLLLILACLLASSLHSARSEDEDCPSTCTCTEEGFGPYIARCSQLNPQEKFGSKISRLVIENNNSLVVDEHTFENVGLQNVSTILIQNCTFKKFSPKAFAGLNLLGKLMIDSCKQLIFDPDMFKELESLTSLIIKNVALKFSRESSYLFDIPLLRTLNLSNCGIKELPPEAFSKMPLLQEVILSSNKLKNLGKEFANLNELEEVDLSFNLISEVGHEVFENKNIDGLKLRGNPLTTMAGVVLKNVIDLDVSQCKFSKIDNSTFSGFSSIKYLNLSGNALTEIAENSFENVSTLATIDLSNNALQGPLPEGVFNTNSRLGVLILAHNPKLGDLPKNIFDGLGSLFRLDLSVCGIKNLEDSIFENLESLTTLYLSGNYLNILKPGVLKKIVTELDLSHNKFVSLDDIKFPLESRLRKLILSGNPLNDIHTSSLSDLSMLETLDLSSCSLNSLWDVTSPSPQLTNLQTFSVADNNIVTISTKQLELTPKLMGIDIINNPFHCNSSFTNMLQWFRKNSVRPSIDRVASLKLGALRSSDVSDVEYVSLVGWSEIDTIVCGDINKEPIEPKDEDDDQNYLDNVDKENGDEDEDEDEDEEEEEDEDEDDESYTDDKYSTGLPNNGLDNIVWRESTMLADSYGNYTWSIMIVLFSGLLILFALGILAACILRWSRQRNSYGARMINTHLHPPMMKRGRSSIYQQLFEDPNHTTTPIMPKKSTNQTQYNFPEGQGAKQYGYITYLSKDFHDSTVMPESV